MDRNMIEVKAMTSLSQLLSIKTDKIQKVTSDPAICIKKRSKQYNYKVG